MASPRGYDWLQSTGLSIEVTEIVVHEADEPDAVVDLPNADLLPGKCGTKVDLASFVSDTATVGNQCRSVMKRILEMPQALVRPGGITVVFRRHLHVQRLVRSFPIVVLDEVFDYIERFQNRRRRHSRLGGLNPVGYEKQTKHAYASECGSWSTSLRADVANVRMRGTTGEVPNARLAADQTAMTPYLAPVPSAASRVSWPRYPLLRSPQSYDVLQMEAAQ